MPIIDASGQVLPDAPPASEAMAWEDLKAQAPAALNEGAAVCLAADIDPATLAPYLGSLARVFVLFPKFNDGRGFTLARRLRREWGYGGSLCATGHLIPDQFAALIACGFDRIETSDRHPPAQWAAPPSGGTGQLLTRRLGR